MNDPIPALILATALSVLLAAYLDVRRTLQQERREWRDRENKLLEKLTGVSLTPESPSPSTPIRGYVSGAELARIERERNGRVG